MSRIRISAVLLAVALVVIAVAVAVSAGAATGVRLVKVGSFNQPVYVTGAPGDTHRVFVVQRTGQIKVMVDGHTLARPFLDIAKRIGSGFDEQGLLGLAFSPGYARNGLLYVYYTQPDNNIRIAQYHRASANVADASSARTVLSIAHSENQNHNGGQMAFGPDGDLYVGVGDGGSEGDPHSNGQNTDTPLAKILRISPSAKGGYTIPRGNPFAGRRGKLASIWAYGLRNPWRFSFDSADGALIIGDVGQDLAEEIDYAARGTGAGANYGWSIYEGFKRFRPGTAVKPVAPVVVGAHSDGYCAIVGGYVVRDHSLPGLYGHYLFGDNCRSQIESVKLSQGHATGLRATGLNVTATSSFGQDSAGHIYIASFSGPVYRLAGG